MEISRRHLQEQERSELATLLDEGHRSVGMIVQGAPVVIGGPSEQELAYKLAKEMAAMTPEQLKARWPDDSLSTLLEIQRQVQQQLEGIDALNAVRSLRHQGDIDYNSDGSLSTRNQRRFKVKMAKKAAKRGRK